MRHVLSRRDKKKSPSIIPFSMRNKHEKKPTMTLKKINTYDNMENNRLKLKRMVSVFIVTLIKLVVVTGHKGKVVQGIYLLKETDTNYN